MEKHHRTCISKRRHLQTPVQADRPQRRHNHNGIFTRRHAPIQRRPQRQRDNLLGSASKKHSSFAPKTLTRKTPCRVSFRKIIELFLQVPGRPVFCVNRESNTNQKISLDVSACGKWLVSGGTDGKVQVWNVAENMSPTTHMQVSNCIRVLQRKK